MQMPDWYKFQNLSLGADLVSWLDAAPLLSVWGSLSVYHRAEGELFPGLTVVAIVTVGLAFALRGRGRRPVDASAGTRRSALVFYVVAAIAMFGLALGPTPTWNGTPVAGAGPYSLLLALPGFDSLRVPARFAMIMVLCLSAGVMLSWARLATDWPRLRRHGAAAVVGVAIVAESWIGTMPLWDPPRPWDLEASDVAQALLVLPVLNELNDAASMYRSASHGKPLVNGYSGHMPPWFRTLKEGLNTLDPAVLDELARVGVTQIAIVSRNDQSGVWRDYVLTRATLTRETADAAYVLYNLPAPTSRPPRVFDRTVAIAAIDVPGNAHMVAALTDDSLDTRWHSTGPQAGAETVRIDLGSVQPVSAVELSLGRHTFDHPRELVVETSQDGETWDEAWRGHGAVPAIAGGFVTPSRMPSTFDLGDRVARFIRLRQIGTHREAYWSIAELRVLAASREGASQRSEGSSR